MSYSVVLKTNLIPPPGDWGEEIAVTDRETLSYLHWKDLMGDRYL